MFEETPYDENTNNLIAWLTELPDGSSVKWHSDHLTAKKPWSRAWVDVLLEDDVMERLETSWAFTISLPEGFFAPDPDDGDEPDPDEGDEPPPLNSWEFEVPPNMCVAVVWDPGFFGGHEYAENPHGPELACEANNYLKEWPEEKIVTLQKGLTIGSPEAFVIGTAGWTADCISSSLSIWAWSYAKKIINFVWDSEAGPTPMLEKAMATLEAMKSGDQQSYLLKPGEKDGGEGMSIYGSEEVMDFFLTELLEESEEDNG